MNINVNLIEQAIQFYRICGYKGLSVPMIVNKDSLDVTKPNWVENVYHDKYLDKCYVASAEQSFIQMEKDGTLPKEGFYYALTPCIRDERSYDDLTYHIFLKLELIFIGGDQIEQIIHDVGVFFKTIKLNPQRVMTDIGEDIYCNGIELGSYGIRKMPNGLLYTYGTGISEPRTSIALSRNK
jgi:seryl-tRNA synthetase